MTNKYIKPTTTVVKVHSESLLAALSNNDQYSSQPQLSKGANIDFFAFEEEEEVPGKSDDEDWEDWEEEDDP